MVLGHVYAAEKWLRFIFVHRPLSALPVEVPSPPDGARGSVCQLTSVERCPDYRLVTLGVGKCTDSRSPVRLRLRVLQVGMDREMCQAWRFRSTPSISERAWRRSETLTTLTPAGYLPSE